MEKKKTCFCHSHRKERECTWSEIHTFGGVPSRYFTLITEGVNKENCCKYAVKHVARQAFFFFPRLKDSLAELEMYN